MSEKPEPEKTTADQLRAEPTIVIEKSEYTRILALAEENERLKAIEDTALKTFFADNMTLLFRQVMVRADSYNKLIGLLRR